jgi:hypothetical protein
MEDLNAEMELLQNLTASRTPRFTAIDDLPLERHGSVEFLERFGGLQPQNQYFRGGRASDTRSDTRGASDEFLQDKLSRPAPLEKSQLEGFSFPIQPEAVYKGGDLSVRRASGVENVTARETKRPKERQKDKEYRRRTLTHADSSFPILVDRTGAQTWPVGESRASYENVVHGGSPSSHQSVPSPFEQRNDAVVSVRRLATGDEKSSSTHASSGKDQGFEVNLVHAGRTVRQQVHETMMVGQLAVVAAAIFSLDSRTVVLLLFGMTPSL